MTTVHPRSAVSMEEIPVGFTHVLLLRGGEVGQRPALGDTLTSDNLSRTYAMSH